jgi:hypothetical protein
MDSLDRGNHTSCEDNAINRRPMCEIRRHSSVQICDIPLCDLRHLCPVRCLPQPFHSLHRRLILRCRVCELQRRAAAAWLIMCPCSSSCKPRGLSSGFGHGKREPLGELRRVGLSYTAGIVRSEIEKSGSARRVQHGGRCLISPTFDFTQAATTYRRHRNIDFK